MPKEKMIVAEQLGEVEAEGFKIFKEKEWTEGDIKKYLQRRAKLLRHTPSQAEINKDKEGPRMKKVKEMFGTYERAILAAGLKLPPRPFTKYSDEELIAVAQEWSKNHPGRKLSRFILQNNPELPNPSLICQRFGGVLEYFEFAGVPHEDGISPWALEPVGSNCPTSLMYKQVHLRGY